MKILITSDGETNEFLTLYWALFHIEQLLKSNKEFYVSYKE